MSRVYLKIIKAVEKYVPPKFMPLWKHPAGPKTIFFWSPFVKWGLVIASLGDLQRPAELVSVYQSASLAVTGAIWSRYCLVIYPVNYNLFACNVFVGCTGCYQTLRALRYQREHSTEKTKQDEVGVEQEPTPPPLSFPPLSP